MFKKVRLQYIGGVDEAANIMAERFTSTIDTAPEISTFVQELLISFQFSASSFSTTRVGLVCGALKKLTNPETVHSSSPYAKPETSPARAAEIKHLLSAILDPQTGPTIIEEYQRKFEKDRKRLSIMWTLMAYSAAVVESAIVADRWCWLKEQEGINEAWVKAVFDYTLSPRNLVVVGVKK